MKGWPAMLVALAACGYPPLQGLHDANTGDAKGDASPDALGPDYGTFIKVGFPSLSDVPTGTLMWINNMAIDTDGSMCDTRNNQASRYCVIAGSSITLASGKALTAHGSKPLVLLATSTFDLEGTIDVSSRRGGTPGAGAAASCLTTTAATGNSGGFGGSFGGKGGDGGIIAGTPDGTKGIAAPALSTSPTDLRGGCPGGNGSSTTAGTASAGGSGGGAVLIIAVTKIQMNGTINASGAGGKGGPMTESGGGGGGSGGMIVLDTPLIAPGAGPIWLFANGGGGGQGGTGVNPGAGPGDDGQESSAPLTVGVGGNNGGKSGGFGGDGSAGVQGASDAGNGVNIGGGGAGGGGAGFIRTLSIAGALISPPPIAP